MFLSDSQEISRILCNPDVCYGVHNSPPLIPILSQINQFHTMSLSLIFMLYPHLNQGLLSALFPASLTTKNLHEGRAIAQAVSRRPPTAEARVRSRVS